MLIDKVCIVTEGDYSDYHIVKCCATKDRAMRFIKDQTLEDLNDDIKSRRSLLEEHEKLPKKIDEITGKQYVLKTYDTGYTAEWEYEPHWHLQRIKEDEDLISRISLLSPVEMYEFRDSKNMSLHKFNIEEFEVLVE